MNKTTKLQGNLIFHLLLSKSSKYLNTPFKNILKHRYRKKQLQFFSGIIRCQNIIDLAINFNISKRWQFTWGCDKQSLFFRKIEFLNLRYNNITTSTINYSQIKRLWNRFDPFISTFYYTITKIQHSIKMGNSVRIMLQQKNEHYHKASSRGCTLIFFTLTTYPPAKIIEVDVKYRYMGCQYFYVSIKCFSSYESKS